MKVEFQFCVLLTRRRRRFGNGMREAWASSSSIWKWGYLSNVLCDEINERWENTEHGRTESLQDEIPAFGSLFIYDTANRQQL